MRHVSKDTGHQPASAPKLRSAKMPSGTKQPVAKTTRSTLHLGETTVKRLGVHCSLVGRNASRVADEILTVWLARYGQGRKLFDSPDSVDIDDREDGGPGARDTGEDGALPRGL